MFCRTNIIHIIKWNNNGCLMCPLWFSRKYCFRKCNYKASNVPDDEVPEDKRKAYKTYLNKICSWYHRPVPSGIRPEWEPPPWNPPPLDSQSKISHGVCTSNNKTFNECGSRDCVPKSHSTVRSGCKSKDCSPEMHSGNSSQNCTYTVRLGCKSRASIPKMHPNCTYTVWSGCEKRASVPKLHPNLIEACGKLAGGW